MLRCAASLVIAAYNLKVTREKIRLIPQDLRALPLELLKKSFTMSFVIARVLCPLP